MPSKEAEIHSLLTAISEGAKETALDSLESLRSQIVAIQHHYEKCTSIEDLHTVEVALEQVVAQVEGIRRDVFSQVMFKTSMEMVWGNDPLAKLANDVMNAGKVN